MSAVRSLQEHRAPASAEAEQSVLGSLLLCPDALANVTLCEEDFSLPNHRLIFREMLRLYAAGKVADVVTLGEALPESSSYMIGLVSNSFSAFNVSAYADIVRDKSIARRVMAIAQELQHRAQSGDGLDSADYGIRELMELCKASTRHEGTLKDALREAWKDVQDAHEHPGQIRGVTTGLARLDASLGGFHATDFSIFGARPAMGKTSLLLHFAESAAKAGHSVGLISAEMAKMQVGQRHLSMASRVHAYKMRNGQIQDEDWSRLNNAMTQLIARRYFIYDRSAPELSEVVRVARKWKQQHGIAILFVDYLQRIRVKGLLRNEEVAEVSRGMKTLARDLDISVVSAAQVKADVESRADQRPRMSDVANSDEACREADQVVMLYRDAEVHPTTGIKAVAELNVEKNRHGPTGLMECAWLAETMTFGNLAYASESA